MNLLDIKKSVNLVLINSFPEIKIRANETDEGFKKPSFFTQLFHLMTENETVNVKREKIMIVISYFSSSHSEIDNLKMIDKLNIAFGQTLKVKERHLKLNNIRSDNPNKILQFKFDLDYLLKVEKADNNQRMGKVETIITKE